MHVQTTKVKQRSRKDKGLTSLHYTRLVNSLNIFGMVTKTKLTLIMVTLLFLCNVNGHLHVWFKSTL